MPHYCASGIYFFIKLKDTGTLLPKGTSQSLLKKLPKYSIYSVFEDNVPSQ